MVDSSAWDGLRERLPGQVTARRLASETVTCSVLAHYYPPEFARTLTVEANGKRGPLRSVDEWVEECRELIDPSLAAGAEHLCFALILVAGEPLARDFRRAHPEASGFEELCQEFIESLSHDDKQAWDDLLGTAPSPVDRRRLPAMSKAIDHGRAEFSLLSEARSYQQPTFNDHPDQRGTYRRFYPYVLTAFERRYGRVVEEYWCASVPAGLVRTAGEPSRRQLHFDGDYPSDANTIVNRCKELRRRAEESLGQKDREYLTADLYSLISDMYAELDDLAESESSDDDGLLRWLEARLLGSGGAKKIDVAHYNQRLDEIEAQLDERMARRGQRWYIAGVGAGLVFLSIVFTGLIVAFDLGSWQAIFRGAIFGAGGALASVLYRMNRGDLEVNASQGWTLVGVAALVRPVTGAIFGGAIAALMLSNLLPVDVPKDDLDRFYFLGVLSFVAGFSERWAPDLLEVAGKQVATKAEAKDEEEKGKAGKGQTAAAGEPDKPQ